jgi:hypothetical protein
MSRRVTPTIALVSLLLLAAAAEPMPAAAAEEVRQGSSARVGTPMRGEPGITETVGEIMERDRKKGLADRTLPRVAAPAPGPAPPKQASPASALQRGAVRATSAAVPVLGTSFKAVEFIADSPFVPPDTMGAVGPTQILVHTNGRVRLFDKSGAMGALNTTADNFWASVGGVTNGTSDPHVEYDRLSERWFLTIITVNNSPNDVLVARSSGPTITDGTSFTFFGFQGEAGRFTDYPTLGVDKHAVYIGANMFDAVTFGFRNTTVFVIDKADLLTTPPVLNVTAFRNLISMPSFDGPFTPQPATNWDPNATHGYFVGVDAAEFDELNVLRISDPAGTPTLTRVDIIVPMMTTSPLDVPQPSGAPLLDALDDRIFEVIAQRLPGGEPRLWLAHNIQVDTSGTASDTGGRTGSRWYELSTLSTIPTVIQSGTIFDPAASQPFSYWIPSIAANGQGHAVIGMSRAGENVSGGHASAAVAERLPGDPLGTMGAPTVVQPSTLLYDTFVMGTERWGDYSQTVIDPTDNMTFWTFQEYTSATNRWGVQVMEIRARPPATPASASPSTVPACSSADVEVTGTSTDGSAFFDPGPDTGGPGFAKHIEGAVDGGVSVNGTTFTDPTHVTIDVDTSAASAGPKGVAITNPDGQQAATLGLLTVSGTDGDDPAPFDLLLPAQDAAVSATPTFSWQASSDTGCGLDKYQLWIDGMLNRDDISPSETSTTPVGPLSPGPHTWKIVAVDGASPPNDTDSNETRSFTVVNQAPVLAPIGNKTGTEGQPLSFQVSATDADGDPLTYSASNLPAGASFSPTTRTFSWTPGFTQAGVYPGVHFEVSDGLDSDAEDIQITVSEGTLGPKQVALKAKPKKVEKGKKVKLTATVSPCAGHERDQVELLRGSKKIATKTTNDACVARFRVKMRKKVRFQAVSPQQDDDHLEGRSKKVKVRVV